MPRLKIRLLLLLLAPFLASAVLSEDLKDTNRDGRIDVSDVLTYFRSEAPSAASKQSTRTPTYLILKISRDGLPVSDAPVTVVRSISGLAYTATWTDTTDAWGVASITLTDDGKRPGGYFRIRAYDAGTGEKIGEWGSLPVRGGQEHLVACPIGGRPRILDRTPVDPPSVGRVFMKADQWVRNGTLDQLEGFDTVRLSSYLPAERMRDVSIAGKQLMIGLAPPQAPLDAEFAGDVLDQYPASGGRPFSVRCVDR